MDTRRILRETYYMSTSLLVSLQACVSVVAFIYFIIAFRMAPARWLMIGCLAFSFMPLFAAFGSGDPVSTLTHFPIGFSFFAGVGLAILPPRRFRTNEQQLALIVVTSLYALISYGRPLPIEIWLAFSLPSLVCVWHLVKHRILTDGERAALFLCHCFLMIFLVFYQGNLYVTYVEMMDSSRVGEVLLWLGQSLLLQITIIATVSRIIPILISLPGKNERNYIRRMKKETIPFLARRMDPQSARPKLTFIILAIHTVILIVNGLTELLPPAGMVAVAIVILPIAYDLAVHTHSRLNEAERSVGQ
jgi:hypothetical protein